MEINILNLRKTYFIDGKIVEIFNNIDIKIQSGESVALMGESGIGKSTLLNIIGTLENPTSGNVFFEKSNMQLKNQSELCAFRNKFIGFMFQSCCLFQEFSAFENICIPILISGETESSAKIKANNVLSMIGMQKRKNSKPCELSGGEKQKVAFARAIVSAPKILLADEPTGNLDEKSSENVIDLISEFSEENKSTTIIVTHSNLVAKKIKKKLTLSRNSII